MVRRFRVVAALYFGFEESDGCQPRQGLRPEPDPFHAVPVTVSISIPPPTMALGHIATSVTTAAADDAVVVLSLAVTNRARARP
jgi:hypothetical protein